MVLGNDLGFGAGSRPICGATFFVFVSSSPSVCSVESQHTFEDWHLVLTTSM